MKRRRVLFGFRVEVRSALRNLQREFITWRFLPFTDPHRELSAEEAKAFAEYLRRNGAGGRVISNADDSVVEEWKP